MLGAVDSLLRSGPYVSGLHALTSPAIGTASPAPVAGKKKSGKKKKNNNAAAVKPDPAVVDEAGKDGAGSAEVDAVSDELQTIGLVWCTICPSPWARLIDPSAAERTNAARTDGRIIRAPRRHEWDERPCRRKRPLPYPYRTRHQREARSHVTGP